MKYQLLVATMLAVVLSACGEGKKSLDGHPMDKPPPSADARRDSEPNFDALKEEEPTPVAVVPAPGK
jgi:hypothetical protein